MKLSQVPITNIQKVLLYGPPKSGKTQLVGNLSQWYNLIWFDFENGYKTLQKLPQEYQERIELVAIPDTQSWPIAIETALKVATGQKVKICEQHGKVSCPKCIKFPEQQAEVELAASTGDTIVVFDSLSQISISAMNNILKMQPDDYKPDWEDYRKMKAVMEKLLTSIQQAGFNLICIGHDIDVSKDEKVMKLSAQAGSTNFSRNVGKFFDHVVYCELKNKQHKFGSSTQYSSLALTGSRLDISLEGMEVPSLKPVFDGTWQEQLKKEQNKEIAGRLNPLSAKLGAAASGTKR